MAKPSRSYTLPEINIRSESFQSIFSEKAHYCECHVSSWSSNSNEVCRKSHSRKICTEMPAGGRFGNLKFPFSSRVRIDFTILQFKPTDRICQS